MQQSGFRLKKKRILLSYAQCNQGTPEEFGLHFKWTFQNIINFTYLICCKEDHQETDGQHYHIYFECEPAFETRNARAFDLTYSDGVDSIYYHPNIEFVRRTPWNSVSYVMKHGNYWEYLPENRPKRTFSTLSTREKNKILRDTDPLKLLQDGEITPQQCSNMIKANQIIKSEMAMKIEKVKPIVLWFYGKTGTGKTRTAVQIAKEAGKDYWISSGETLQWFDGYIGQEYAIIDDFRRGMCKFQFLLRLLDVYDMRVQIKHGWTNWVPRIIIITCPVCAKEAWQYFDKDGEVQDWDHIDQLIRRIDDEICFDKFN